MCRIIAVVMLLFLGCFILSAQPYIITTIAGTNRLLDGGSATSAPLRSPIGVAVDSAGNLFIADRDDNRIRKVNSSGIVSTFAGMGPAGYSGDRGRANAALLSGPNGVALDSSGNLYISDRGNARIRRVSTDGTINTIAGNGVTGFSGDNGPALSAEIDPSAVALDSKGNIYIADGLNFRIRKVDTNGTITTIAGTGVDAYGGDNGPATSALIGFVDALAVDSTGNVYIADLTNAYVRKIDASGQITPAAGSGLFGLIDDGVPATSALLLPGGIAVDNSGSLYISDLNRSLVRRVDLSSGLIYTIAGNGSAGYSGDNGLPSRAELNGPSDLAVTESGVIYVADPFNGRVRKIANNVITTVAGTSIHDGALATSAFLNFPEGLAIDGANNILVADSSNYAVRRFSPEGDINTFGQLPGAPFMPHGVATDQAGNFYITEDEPRVLEITPSGTTSNVAGNGQDGYTGDNGVATSAQISNPTGVAVDISGNIYLTDFNHSRIRRVSPAGTITTIAGNGDFHFSGDHGPALSAGLDPYDVAIDNKDNLYVADQFNNRIRKIATDGTITTVAGTGAFGYRGDGGLATSALLAIPTGVAVDNSGNLYIADHGNSTVRRVTSDGFITTIAGNGTQYPSAGDGGSAAAAQLDPWRVAVDMRGNVYVTDSVNDRVRKLSPTLAQPGAMNIVSGNGQSGTIGAGLPLPLVVKVTDTNGAPLPGIIVAFALSPSGAATLNPSAAITLNDGTASTIVTLGINAGAVTITATAGGLASIVTFAATIVTPTLPTIGVGGIASAGLSTPPVLTLAPNAIVSIFGTNFAPPGTARGLGAGDLVNDQIPTNLAGVCVLVANQRAPIFAVYPGQLNVQVPQISSGTAAVQVITNCDTPQAEASNTVNASVQPAAPEFFYFVHNQNGLNPIAAINAVTGAYVGAAGLLAGTTFTPAKPGDILTLFGTGFGATNPYFAPGELPEGVAPVTAPVTIAFGGITLSSSDILYVGLSQEAGVYQVNVRVPDTVPDGDQSFTLSVGGVSSPAGGFITVN